MTRIGNLKEEGAAFIQQMTSRDVYQLVEKTNASMDLFYIVQSRFAAQAHMLNDDNNEPFIEWKPMNKALEPWVPLLLGKIAKMELQAIGSTPTVIIGAPNSATPYALQIRQLGVFADVRFPLVARAPHDGELLLDHKPHMVIPVRSYVHDRDPVTNARTPHNIVVFDPEVIDGASVLLIDDVVAETVTATEFGRGLLQMGAKEVHVAAVMTKEMQGGARLLRENPAIKSVTALIQVQKTNGRNGSIEFQ